MINKLKTILKEWRRKQIWSPDKQLYELRIQVQEDSRWLAHDPVARELTERYLRMLDDRWESQPREFIWKFRERIGLDPHKRSNAELRRAHTEL